AWRLDHAFRHRRARHTARAQLQEFQRQSAMTPEMRRLWRDQSLGNLHHLFHKLFGAMAKGQLDSLLRAEKVRDHREVTSLHSAEKQSRPPAFNDTTMNFCEFEVRID